MIPFLRNVVLKDFWLKLFSFALAVLAYFTVYVGLRNTGSPATPLSFMPPGKRVFPDLPVIVLSSAENVRAAQVNPKEVEVTVQGEAKVLRQLQPKDIRAMVDLTEIKAHDDVKVRIEVSTPAGVTRFKVDPEEVQVIFPPKS